MANKIFVIHSENIDHLCHGVPEEIKEFTTEMLQNAWKEITSRKDSTKKIMMNMLPISRDHHDKSK